MSCHWALQNAIEELGTESLVKGFVLGVLNERGAYWKSMDEGGDQERNLCQRFLRVADECAIEWPKTTAALKRIGDRYASHAKRVEAVSHRYSTH
ncbi:MAG TPA: hypothetical protein VN541_12305, partial [Tepidisphaeraceae bacterium]|nr:hypothetical protein [Tepidisphaeraceae bacterium]